MEAAAKNNIPGMLGECGGNLSCATCHVYVKDAWSDRVGSCVVGSQEDEMLDYVSCERLPNSRLSCQIKMTPELDGVIVRIAPSQT
jgi:2Fe-2S ferredoxin